MISDKELNIWGEKFHITVYRINVRRTLGCVQALPVQINLELKGVNHALKYVGPGLIHTR